MAVGRNRAVTGAAVMMVMIAASIAAAQDFKLPPYTDVLQHIKFTPKLTMGGTHTDVPKLRMWGWSENGLVAYSTETHGCCLGYAYINFVIMNLVTDKKVFELGIDPGEDGAAEEKTYRLNMDKIQQAMAANGIVFQPVEYLPFPIKKDDATYNARIEITSDRNTDQHQHPVGQITSYRVVVDKNGRQSKTITTVRDRRGAAAFYIGGYFLSPYDNRALVLIIEEQWMHGGGGELVYRFSGCHLGTGFR